MDDLDNFDDSGDDGGLLFHGDGDSEDYDDVYFNNKGGGINSEWYRYGDRGVEY